MINPNLLHFGSTEPLPEWVSLRAGPLVMSFDPENLSLRFIRFGNDEVLRAIYAAVRDRNWGTILPRAQNLHVSAGTDEFVITFEASCLQADIDYLWRGSISGGPDGTVRFAFDGEARSRFLRSRIGICVLHPLRECAGQPCELEHTDGGFEQSRFPRLVSPRQPFRNLRAISHWMQTGVKATVRFEGDVFETEDQRNWTDASFKTYSTPLDLPFPVEVSKGSRVRQEVTLSLSGGMISAVSEVKEPQIHVDWSRPTPVPSLGISLSRLPEPMSEREIQRLRALGLGHVRIEARISDPDWTRQLRQMIADAGRIGVPIQLALYLSDNAEVEIARLLEELSARPSRISLWIVHHTGQPETAAWRRLAQTCLAAYGHDIPVAAGADAYFAEWNRNRPSAESRALPCYSLNPQVHGFDLATLVENLGGQADTVRTAFAHTGQPVVVGPVTLKPRFNPNATSVSGEAPPGALPSQVDPRQGSLFGAAWTLGSMAALAGTGEVYSVTFYEAIGWLGIMETAKGSPVPDRFPSVPGGVFPVYHLFADLAGCREVFPLALPHAGPMAGLGCRTSLGQRRLLLANLDRNTRSWKVAVDWRAARIRMLDSSNAERAMRDPEWFQAAPGRTVSLTDGCLDVQLPPFAIARADELS